MNQTRQPDGNSPRTGWRLSNQHQMAIASLAALALAAVGILYGWSVWQGDQSDIDQLQTKPQTFEVDINQAAISELIAVPNVGPKMAQAIVEHRHRQGLFESLEQLQDIPGIGPAKLKQLKKYLRPIE